jgi:hypothetical protein
MKKTKWEVSSERASNEKIVDNKMAYKIVNKKFDKIKCVKYIKLKMWYLN